jgi:hypothetical protein
VVLDASADPDTVARQVADVVDSRI